MNREAVQAMLREDRAEWEALVTALEAGSDSIPATAACDRSRTERALERHS